MVELGFDSHQYGSKVHDLMPHVTAACHPGASAHLCSSQTSLCHAPKFLFSLFRGSPSLGIYTHYFAYVEILPFSQDSPSLGASFSWLPSLDSHGILYRGNLRTGNYLDNNESLTLHFGTSHLICTHEVFMGLITNYFVTQGLPPAPGL